MNRRYFTRTVDKPRSLCTSSPRSREIHPLLHSQPVSLHSQPVSLHNLCHCTHNPCHCTHNLCHCTHNLCHCTHNLCHCTHNLCHALTTCVMYSQPVPQKQNSQQSEAKRPPVGFSLVYGCSFRNSYVTRKPTSGPEKGTM